MVSKIGVLGDSGWAGLENKMPANCHLDFLKKVDTKISQKKAYF